MRNVIIFVALYILTSVSANALTMTSVQNGYWHDPATWGLINTFPYFDTDVVVLHGVIIEGLEECHDLTVETGGSLTTAYGYRSLSVFGAAVIRGNMSSVSGGWPLDVSLHGDLLVEGRVSTQSIDFSGTGDQLFTMLGGAVFTPVDTRSSGDGDLIVDSILTVSTMWDLMGSTIVLNAGGGLYLAGGYLSNGSVSAGGRPIVSSADAWLSNLSIDDALLSGFTRLYSGVGFTGTTTVTDTIQTHFGTATATFEHVINEGLIQNGDWPLFLQISGNVNNSGTWTNLETHLVGSGNQSVGASDTHPIGATLRLESQLGGVGHQWTLDGSPWPGATFPNVDLAPAASAHTGVWQCTSTEGPSRTITIADPLGTAVGRPADPVITIQGNHPNPFNPTTVIGFRVDVDTAVRAEIYDARGRLVAHSAETMYEAGDHSITWSADSLASGTYLYRLIAGQSSAVGRCILIR